MMRPDHAAFALNLTRAPALGWAVVLLFTSAVPASARAEVIERVVAVVNDDAVFLSELRRRAAPYLETLLTEVPKDQRKDQLDLLYKRLLEQLIDEMLIEQTSQEMHIAVSALEVDQALGNVQRQNGMTEDQFWEAVRTQGFTAKQYREDVRKQLLRLKVINQKVRSQVNIHPEEVREAYDDRRRRARRSQRFHAAHLFFELSPEASATTVADVLKQARAATEGLTADNFDNRAAALVGGDLGWLDQGDLPESLENILLDLEPGEISTPVRGPSGYHVFLLKERKQQDESMPTFEESRDAIEQELLAKAMQRQEAIFLDQLRRTAVVDKRR